jgi:MFS family permease
MLQLTLNEDVRKRPHRIDYLGAALMIFGTTSLMFVLVQAAVLPGRTIVGLIVASGVSFTALLIHESRTLEPMLPLKLFRNRIVASGNVVGLANGAIMMGIVAFLPAYMQGVLGSTALLAGVALTAMSVAWPIGGLIGSRIMLLFSYRVAATIGSVVLLIGSLLMIALNPALGVAWPIAGALLVGLGLGVTNICYVVAVQANVDWAQRGIATSSTSFSRIVGQAIGTAVFAGIINFGLSGHTGAESDIVVRMMQRGLRQAVEMTDIAAAMDTFTHSLHNVYLVNGLLALVVFAAVRFLPAGLRLVQETGER